LNNTTEGGAEAAQDGMAAALKAGKREREPTHPGEVAASAIRRAGLNQNSAAIAMGVTPQSLAKVLSGKSAMTPKMALRVAALLGSQAEMWLTLQADFDLWHARAEIGKELAKIKRAEVD
jgi:addiction module HigA family antidote